MLSSRLPQVDERTTLLASGWLRLNRNDNLSKDIEKLITCFIRPFDSFGFIYGEAKLHRNKVMINTFTSKIFIKGKLKLKIMDGYLPNQNWMWKIKIIQSIDKGFFKIGLECQGGSNYLLYSDGRAVSERDYRDNYLHHVSYCPNWGTGDTLKMLYHDYIVSFEINGISYGPCFDLKISPMPVHPLIYRLYIRVAPHSILQISDFSFLY